MMSGIWKAAVALVVLAAVGYGAAKMNMPLPAKKVPMKRATAGGRRRLLLAISVGVLILVGLVGSATMVEFGGQGTRIPIEGIPTPQQSFGTVEDRLRRLRESKLTPEERMRKLMEEEAATK